MKQPIWLRLTGYVALGSLLVFMAAGLVGSAPKPLLVFGGILFFGSLLVGLVGSVWWRLERRRLKAAAPPVRKPPRPTRTLGARMRRPAIIAALVVFVPLLLFVVTFRYNARKVRRIEKGIAPGMGVAQLMSNVDGWFMMQVRSLDADGGSAWIMSGDGQRYVWHSGEGRGELLSREELIGRLQRSNSGWQISYTYRLGATPARYSFGVVLGPDGTIRSVIPGHMWD
jgi:hypothetical protein